MPWAAENGRGFDAAVVDREDHPVALIQVKSHPIDEGWIATLAGQLPKSGQRVDFILIIDPDSIRLYRWKGDDIVGPLVRLDTKQVLRHYDPEFPRERVFEAYLLTLVEAWLRDLAYRWKSPDPPGLEPMDNAGFLGKVEGGTTLPFGA